MNGNRTIAVGSGTDDDNQSRDIADNVALQRARQQADTEEGE
jgi:hypothetical protein